MLKERRIENARIQHHRHSSLLLPHLRAPVRKKRKKIKASANPPAYVAFSQPLTEQERAQHALDRLTFGARPGDVDALNRTGLGHWIRQQLHPEQVAENPLLASKLAPLDTVRMGIHDTWAHYPPPQAIAAFARGRGQLPDDPELRALVVRLSERYLQRRSEKENTSATATQLTGAPAGTIDLNAAPPAKSATAVSDPNDTSDLDLKVKITDILSPAQIETLRSGKPDEKVQLLASIPPERRLDFAWALRNPARQRLMGIAPVEVRRALMMAQQPQNVVTSDLSEAKFLRATYGGHQLEELLDDFWFNHFNVFINKGADHYLVPTYERESIRPHVLGKFQALLTATAKSPAMLFYLDNWQSVGPDVAARQNRNRPNAPRRGLNENYGRELLELHTLGVDGGYTQQDVIEVARCFTGWTIANPRKGGTFEYNDKVHDKGQKTVLGHVIKAGGGMDDGLKVIDILSHHPSTAHFISLKLAKRFVADDPPPSLVNRMAQTFLKTDGDLRAVITTMIESPEFWSRGAYNAKIKTPFEMVVSSVRATNADVQSAFPLVNELNRLGEPLYRKIEPTGYSSANAEWVSSSGLLDRMNFAIALAHNRVPGIKVDIAEWQTRAAQDPMLFARGLLVADPSQQTRSAIEKMLHDPALQSQLAANARAGPPQIPSLVAGLVIGSPDFQRR